MTANTDDRILTQKELAERWGITPRTLQNWYKVGKGPKRVKIGCSGYRYRLSDVLAYEESMAQEPGTQAPPKHEFKEEHRLLGVAARKAKANKAKPT